MKPQARKVLRALEAAGDAGVHSRQLRADFIADPPTRVCELRRLGYNIDRQKEGNGTRYRLLGLSEGVTGQRSAVGSPADSYPANALDRTPSGDTLAESQLPDTDAARSTSPPRGPSETPGSTPGGRGFYGSVVLERKPLTKHHSLAHQPPDGREGWVLCVSYLGPEPDWRWELRAPTQLEAAKAAA